MDFSLWTHSRNSLNSQPSTDWTNFRSWQASRTPYQPNALSQPSHQGGQSPSCKGRKEALSTTSYYPFHPPQIQRSVAVRQPYHQQYYAMGRGNHHHLLLLQIGGNHSRIRGQIWPTCLPILWGPGGWQCHFPNGHLCSSEAVKDRPTHEGCQASGGKNTRQLVPSNGTVFLPGKSR